MLKLIAPVLIASLATASAPQRASDALAAVVAAKAVTDDASMLQEYLDYRQQRRLEAPRREQPRAGADRGAADDVVQQAAWQHGQRAGHVDPPAARPDAGDVGRALAADVGGPRRS